MASSNDSAGRAGRPTPQWLHTLATELVARLRDRGMTVTVGAAKAIVADRLTALAAALRITERSARVYMDHDALEGLADGLVESFAEEEPGKDLMTLPRTAALRVSGIGRLVAPWPSAFSSLKPTRLSMRL